MRIKISSMFDLFCLIGCLYQIYDITKFYLQFKVRRDVTYDYSTYVELPAIDIIVPMVMAMNFSKLFAAYPENMHSMCEQLHEIYKKLNYTNDNPQAKCEAYQSLWFNQRFPFEERFERTTVQNIKMFANDLREQVKLALTSFGFLTDRHCALTRYYNGVAILMRIFCFNGTKPFTINTNIVSINKGIGSYLQYFFGHRFGIRLSHPADLPVYEESKYFMITRKPGSWPLVTLSFVKTVMSSLEYPYETNCRYYNKVESIAKCMTEYTLGQSTPYLYETATYEWDAHPGHLGFNPVKDGKIVSREVELDALANCTQQSVATECEKTIYLVEGKIFEQVNGGFGLIVIEPSWRVNMYHSVHPVLPWSEYVIFIGSILGFWFGISLHDIIFKILICFKTNQFSLLIFCNNNDR